MMIYHLIDIYESVMAMKLYIDLLMFEFRIVAAVIVYSF